MTRAEIDAFVLRLVTLGANQIDSTSSPGTGRGKYGTTPQYLATMLRDELGITQTGMYWPSREVEASLRRLRAAGLIVDALWSPVGCGYLGVGATRPTIPHRPRALQLVAESY